MPIPLNPDEGHYHNLVKQELFKLNDMKYLFENASMIQKQGIINRVFDRSLQYFENAYRTNFVMDVFSLKVPLLERFGLPYLNKKGDFFAKIPSGGAEESRTPVQT